MQILAEDVPAAGLAAFEFELSFDSSLIHLSDPNSGFSSGVDPFAPLGSNPFCTAVRGSAPCPDPAWFLTSTGRTPLGISNIDNGSGTLLIAYGTHGAQPLPSGNGVLALIDVTGVGVGSASIAFDTAILADADEPPGSYALTAINFNLEVVPEPGTGILLGLGLARLGLARRSRRLRSV